MSVGMLHLRCKIVLVLAVPFCYQNLYKYIFEKAAFLSYFFSYGKTLAG